MASTVTTPRSVSLSSLLLYFFSKIVRFWQTYLSAYSTFKSHFYILYSILPFYSLYCDCSYLDLYLCCTRRSNAIKQLLFYKRAAEFHISVYKIVKISYLRKLTKSRLNNNTRSKNVASCSKLNSLGPSLSVASQCAGFMPRYLMYL